MKSILLSVLSLAPFALLALAAAPADAHGPRVVGVRGFHGPRVAFVQPRVAFVQPSVAFVAPSAAFVAPSYGFSTRAHFAPSAAFVQPAQSVRFGPFGRVRQVNF